LGAENKWNSDAWINLEKHYAKWKKPDTKGHRWYNSNERKSLERVNL
jgi:hypothetical protein